MPPADFPAAPRIIFDGRTLAAAPGQTVAACLLAAGIRTITHGRAGAPRGAFCGVGVCHDCLVTIDGRPSRRSCLTLARDGMVVASQRADAVPIAEPVPDQPGHAKPLACDVLIVGGGQSGLTASLACGAGLDIHVIDEKPRDSSPLLAQARRAGVSISFETTVWGAFRTEQGTLEIGLANALGVTIARPRVLIVAAGSYDNPLLVPGWTLPGVMTVRAARDLLAVDGTARGQRILIAGTGLPLLELADGLRRRGATIAAVAEAAPPLTPDALAAAWRTAPTATARRARLLKTLRRAAVPVLFRKTLAGIEGETHVTAARLVSIMDRPASGARTRRIEVDAVCLRNGTLPADELPRLLGCLPLDDTGALCGAAGLTTQPDIFVIDDGAGRRAASQTGRRVRQALGLPPDIRAAEAARPGRRETPLPGAPPTAPSPDPATILCRCESLDRAALEAAIARHGLTALSMLKRATRAGMGRCQGLYCTAALTTLLPRTSRDRFAPQVPIRPVPAGSLAEEAPEWRGHRRTALPGNAPPPAPGRPLRDAETVIIGGGIAGLSTALFLAREGHDVAVLDRGEAGAEASGGNAGSLHVQLLSFDFNACASPDSPALRTLPLQRDAAALWERLERDLATPMEITREGGLMIAETADELAALKRKVALEAACGIDSELLSPTALHDLAPWLRPGLRGAAFCRDEGKINPLLATQAILDAARQAGARILPHRAVTALTQAPGGFLVHCGDETMRARRVVNAAGAWSSRIAAMLGLALPVHGAPLQMIVTEPAAPLSRHLLAHAGRHLSLKQSRAGGFIIGGGWSAGLDPVRQHPRPTRQSLQGNLWVACHLVPALARLHVVRSWAAMNIDIDGAPILGEQIPGVFNVVGSNGYTLGPLLGQITAGLIMHGDPGRDISAFGLARFGAGQAPAH